MVVDLFKRLAGFGLILGAALSWAADCGRGLEPTADFDEQRWTLNENGTVGDVENKLMWKRCPEGLKGPRCREGRLAFLTWEEALEEAEDSDFAGFTDWRIPKFAELEGLIEPGCLMPATNLALFPSTPSGWFWFDSAEAENSPRAGQLSFAFGEEFSASQRNVVNLRLVRTIPEEPTPPDEPAPAPEPQADVEPELDADEAVQPVEQPVDEQPAPDEPAAPDQPPADGAAAGDDTIE